MTERRTQEERRGATRRALLDAGRELFAREGYRGASQEGIVELAGVTRGALYHHFEDGKRGLFRDIVVEIQDELEKEIFAAGRRKYEETGDMLEGYVAGTLAYFGACLRPEVRGILMQDGVSVLGWEDWYAIDAEYGISQNEAGLKALVKAGVIEEQPVAPVAHMIYGATLEAATYIVASEDAEKAIREMEAVLRKFLDGLRQEGGVS